MTKPKQYLKDIYRTPLDHVNRIEYMRLDKNENLIPISQDFLASITKQITPDFLATYPQVSLLYDKLAASLGLTEDYLFLSTGSEGAIKTIFEAYVEPHDRVIIPDPTYAMYEVFGKLFKADLVKIPYDTSLNLNLNAMVKRFNKKTKLVVLANPNSPTGTIVPPKDLESFIAAAEKKSVLVLIDEAYYPYYPKSSIPLVKKYRNLIVTRSFSKAFGLASLRIGFAVAQPETLQWLKVFRPMYETNGFSVLFANAMLDNMHIVENNVKEVTEGRNYLVHEMERRGFKTFESQTNFVNINVGKHLVDPLIRNLEQNGILIKPGADHPALHQCVRITVGSVDQMKLLISYIEDYLAGVHSNR